MSKEGKCGRGRSRKEKGEEVGRGRGALGDLKENENNIKLRRHPGMIAKRKKERMVR